jgi:outer membrane protein assembly factor BamB
MLYTLNPSGAKLWECDLGTFAPGNSKPALAADGSVYVHATEWTGGSINFGRERLLKVSSQCRQLWHYDPEPSGSLVLGDLSSPVVGQDDTVYLGDFSGWVSALSSQGAVLWSKVASAADTQSIVTDPVLRTDGTIYVSDLFHLVAMAAADGAIKWTFEPPGAQSDAKQPAIRLDGTIYLSESNMLNAIRPADGSVLWSATVIPDATFTTERIGGAPAVAGDGTIYVATDYDRLYSISPSGVVNWCLRPDTPGAYSCSSTNYELETLFSHSPVVAPDGTVYFRFHPAGNPGSVWAISPDGTPLWSASAPDDETAIAVGWFPQSAVASDGTLYMPYVDMGMADAPRFGLRAYR